MEDEKQDRIVIYNEVIDTLRAIMNILKYKKSRKIKKKKMAAGLNVSPSPKKQRDFFKPLNDPSVDSIPPLYRTSEKYDLLEEIERQMKDGNDEEGFTISKSMIMEAWRKFRPINKPSDDLKTRTKNAKIRTSMKDIREIWPKKFIWKLMSQTHLRMYNF